MADKKEFRFVISASDHASLQLAAVTQKLSSLEKSAGRLNAQSRLLSGGPRSFSGAMGALSGSIGAMTDFSKTRIALPAIAFGGYALKQSGDFEAATN
ncbi:MAG: hypothetical protein EOP10_24930, partial [Proteobacteria bacterium]